jgi:ribosomal protein L7/L12
MAKLDKIAFAKLAISIQYWITSDHNLSEYDLQRLEELTEIPDVPETVPTRANASDVNELLCYMSESTKKLEAIKAYRQLTGLGLKESKDAVEKYWVEKSGRTAKTLVNAMLSSLNSDICIIPKDNVNLVRRFIESFYTGE